MKNSQHVEIVNAYARLIGNVAKALGYLYLAGLLHPESLSSLLRLISSP